MQCQDSGGDQVNSRRKKSCDQLPRGSAPRSTDSAFAEEKGMCYPMQTTRIMFEYLFRLWQWRNCSPNHPFLSLLIGSRVQNVTEILRDKCLGGELDSIFDILQLWLAGEEQGREGGKRAKELGQRQCLGSLLCPLPCLPTALHSSQAGEPWGDGGAAKTAEYWAAPMGHLRPYNWRN